MKTAYTSRRGTTLAYMTVAIVALVGLCSLAADYGRVQLAKTELQQAADASARAGVSELPNVNAVRSEATALGQANQAAGTAVAMNVDQDVEFLTWNQTSSTFVVRTGVLRSRANAIRVTTRRTNTRGNAVELFLGRAVGMPTFNVQASATAMIRRSVGPTEVGFVGLDSLEVTGSVTVDSFNSAVGAPGGNNFLQHGTIASNGDVSVTGSSTIYGDARSGMDAELTLDPDSHVTGSTEPMSTELEYNTPVAGSASTVNNNGTIPGSFLKNGARDLEVGNNQTLTLGGGTYYFRNIKLSGGGTIRTTGPATIYATGTVDLAGNTDVSGQRAKNFKLFVTGSGNVELGGTSTMTVDILAPLSHVRLHGDTDLRGRIIGRTLLVTGNPRLHFDETLLSGTSSGITTPPSICLVK